MKNKTAFLSGFLAVLSAAAGIFLELKDGFSMSALTVNGITDGPTSVFIAAKVNYSLGFLTAGAVFLAITLFLFWKSHKKN